MQCQWYLAGVVKGQGFWRLWVSGLDICIVLYSLIIGYWRIREDGVGGMADRDFKQLAENFFNVYRPSRWILSISITSLSILWSRWLQLWSRIQPTSPNYPRITLKEQQSPCRKVFRHLDYLPLEPPYKMWPLHGILDQYMRKILREWQYQDIKHNWNGCSSTKMFLFYFLFVKLYGFIVMDLWRKLWKC